MPTVVNSYNPQVLSTNVTISKSRAILVGILGIILPIGIQDFVVDRVGWGLFHLISRIAFIPGYFIVLSDGLCAGGSFCQRAPGIFSIIGSVIIATNIASLAFNLFECILLMEKRTIDCPKKLAKNIVLVITIIFSVLVFVFKFLSYLLKTS